MTPEQNKKIMGTPRFVFDSRVGIISQAKNQYGLQEVSELRKLYCQFHPGVKLAEYVVFGEFLLTDDGELHRIEGIIPNKEKCAQDVVVTIENFLNITGLESYKTTLLM